MPITFAQPDPMAPAVTASAAAAEFAAKTFPTIASIYENAARIRASAGGGGGGGGHGGVVQGGGPIQVLPSGDGGAGLYQVEAQANREQRALDLGFEAQQDPVARHIQMQADVHQQAETRKNQQQQEMFRQMNPDLFQNGQRPPAAPVQQQQPQPTTFTPDDEAQLAGTMQAMTDLRNKANIVPTQAFSQMMAPLEQQQNTLLAKKRKADDDALQQKNQQEMRQGLHQTAMVVAQGQGLVAHSPVAQGDVPGIPPDRWMPDGRGGWKNVNEKKQEEMLRAAHTMQEQQIKLQQSQADLEEKHFAEDRKLAHDELTKEAGKDATGKQNAVSPEDVEKRRAELSRIRADDRERRGLEKNANPQVRAAYVDHIDSLPKTEDGAPNYSQADNGQLAKLGRMLADPKAVGVTKKDATEGIAKIRKILTDRAAAQKALAGGEITPGAPGLPPAPPRGVADQPTHVFQYDASNLQTGSAAYKRLTSKQPLPEEIEWYKSTHGGQLPPK